MVCVLWWWGCGLGENGRKGPWEEMCAFGKLEVKPLWLPSQWKLNVDGDWEEESWITPLLCMVLEDGVLYWEKTTGGWTDLMVEVRNSGFFRTKLSLNISLNHIKWNYLMWVHITVGHHLLSALRTSFSIFWN